MDSNCFSVSVSARTEPFSGRFCFSLCLCIATESVPLQILEYTDHCIILYPSFIKNFRNLRLLFLFCSDDRKIKKDNNSHKFIHNCVPVAVSVPADQALSGFPVMHCCNLQSTYQYSYLQYAYLLSLTYQNL